MIDGIQITALPSAGPITGAEETVVIQNGQGVKSSLANNVSYMITAAETNAGITPASYQYTELDPRRYGVDVTGTSDSSIAVANWLAVAVQYTSVILQYPQNGKCRIDSGITIDTNRIGIDWNGCQIDMTRYPSTGVAGFQFTQSETNPNIQPLRNSAHPISNAYVIGPGAGVPVSALYTAIPGLKLQNIQFQDWTTDITIAAGAFCCTFTSCSFTVVTAGSDLTYSIQIAPGATGERNVFIDCFWFNRAYLINAQSGNSDTYFTNCSFDTFTRAFNVLAGYVTLTACHIEDTSDTDYWGNVTTGTLYIRDSIFISQVARSNYDFFTSSVAGAGGGCFIERCVLQTGSNSITVRLIGGIGTSKATQILQQASSARPVMCVYQNLFAYGNFESSAWAHDWTLSGSTLPSRTNAQAHGGTYSMQIVGVVAQATPAGAARTVGCIAGQYLQGEMWLLAPALSGTGSTFSYSVLYLDAAGSPISGAGNTVNTTVNFSAWTHTVIAAVNPAPTGTASAQFVMTLSTPTSGSPVVYIDDVIVNVT